MKERERENEGLKLSDDQSAEERYLARSARIQYATLHLMALEADRNQSAETGKRLVVYSGEEELARDCANWVKKAKWGSRRGNSETTFRWALQFMSPLGPFKWQVYSPGSWIVTWRNLDEQNSVWEELSPFVQKWKIPQVEIAP